MRNCEILILGGGITACATALSMQETGHKEVWLLAPTFLGDDSSALSSALLHGYHELAALADLSTPAPQAYQNWAEEADEDLGLKRCGMLVIADEALAPRVLGRGLRLGPHGMAAEEVDEDGLAQHEPRGTFPAKGAGLWLREAALLDPRRTIDVLSGLAARRGVRVIQGESPLQLSTREDRVTGIATSHGRIEAEWTVLASDSVLQRLAPEMAGRALRPTLRPFQLLQPAADFGAPIKILWHERLGLSWRPLPGGWIRRSGLDPQDAPLRDPLLPALDRATLWASGVWESTSGKDERPVVGPAPQWQRLLIAAGFGARDFDLAPTAGHLLVQWVKDGGLPGGMAAILDPRRFLT